MSSSSIKSLHFLLKDLKKIIQNNDEQKLSSILNDPLRTRKDEINDGKIRDKILENSPNKNEQFFVVPKVIE